jgi:hypothetical protein
VASRRRDVRIVVELRHVLLPLFLGSLCSSATSPAGQSEVALLIVSMPDYLLANLALEDNEAGHMHGSFRSDITHPCRCSMTCL